MTQVFPIRLTKAKLAAMPVADRRNSLKGFACGSFPGNAATPGWTDE